jgi:hypothetical protein
MGFRDNVQRGAMLGLGCAGALPALQRATDFVRANPTQVALMVAVEICSACYYVDNTLETVVGNAICADGAAAFLLARDSSPDRGTPRQWTSKRFLTLGGSKTSDCDIRTANYASYSELRFTKSPAPWLKGRSSACCNGMGYRGLTSISGCCIQADGR